MLLKCSPLYLLSMLQLVVLSGIIAAYSNSYQQTPAPQTAIESTTTTTTTITSRNSLRGNARTVPTGVKSKVMLKPVSLSYLRDNLDKVSSLLDFVRLFANPETEDPHLSHFISRTIRSASYPNMIQPRHNVENNADFSGVGENNGGNDVVRDDFMSLDTPDTEEDGVGDDASNVNDLSDHYYDYGDPQEEPSADDMEAFEAALHNIEDMKTNPVNKCQRPTLFVHRVQNPNDDSQVFLPECVILHRCMNHSGCCQGSDHVCSPKSMNIVVKSFLVVNRLSAHDDDVMFDAHMATTLSFVNHTECECRQKVKQPECTKECPRLFHLTQDENHCICDCFSMAGDDLWKCEIVKDGVKTLPADGLACIQSGNCYKPRCAEGEFDAASGYCPLADKYTLPGFTFENPADRHHHREHLSGFNFSSPYGKVASSAKNSIISPTPSFKNGGLSQNNFDKPRDVGQVLSRNASVHATQTVSEISESSSVSFTESSDVAFTESYDVSFTASIMIFSIATTDLPTTSEADESSEKSTNEARRSVHRSCDDQDIDDCDDCEYDDSCGESSELAEGQRALGSTSRVTGEQTRTARKIGNDVSDASTVLSASSVQTKDTNSETKTSQNVLSVADLLLSLGNGYRQNVGSVNDDDDDDNDDDADDDDDDDDEYIDKDDSSKNDYKDSSYKDYQTDSSSTDYSKDSKDVSSKHYFKDSLTADYHTDSSFDPPRTDSHQASSNKDHHKDSSVDDHHEDPSFEGRRKDSSNKHHHKHSPSKHQPSEKRQSAPNTNLIHKFQTDSQFHETVHSDGTSEEGQTDSKNINAENSVFTPLTRVSSVAPSDTSLASTKLPKTSSSSPLSSSASVLSSLSPQTSSPPSRLSMLFSLTMNSEAQNLATSTRTPQTNDQDDLKTSSEKSFLRRLYTHRDASSDASGEVGG